MPPPLQAQPPPYAVRVRGRRRVPVRVVGVRAGVEKDVRRGT